MVHMYTDDQHVLVYIYIYITYVHGTCHGIRTRAYPYITFVSREIFNEDNEGPTLFCRCFLQNST